MSKNNGRTTFEPTAKEVKAGYGVAQFLNGLAHYNAVSTMATECPEYGQLKAMEARCRKELKAVQERLKPHHDTVKEHHVTRRRCEVMSRTINGTYRKANKAANVRDRAARKQEAAVAAFAALDPDTRAALIASLK